MGNTTVLIADRTLDKVRQVKLIMSVREKRQLNYDETLSTLADKFLAESKESKQ